MLLGMILLAACGQTARNEQAAYVFVKLGYRNIREFGGIIDRLYEIEK